jgi:hypothetical protein
MAKHDHNTAAPAPEGSGAFPAPFVAAGRAIDLAQALGSYPHRATARWREVASGCSGRPRPRGGHNAHKERKPVIFLAEHAALDVTPLGGIDPTGAHRLAGENLRRTRFFGRQRGQCWHPSFPRRTASR